MKCFIVLVVASLASCLAFSQNIAQRHSATLLSVSCPRCKAPKESYEEKELVYLMRVHASSHHKLFLKDTAIKQMIRANAKAQKKEKVPAPANKALSSQR